MRDCFIRPNRSFSGALKSRDFLNFVGVLSYCSNKVLPPLTDASGQDFLDLSSLIQPRIFVERRTFIARIIAFNGVVQVARPPHIFPYIGLDLEDIDILQASSKIKCFPMCCCRLKCNQTTPFEASWLIIALHLSLYTN